MSSEPIYVNLASESDDPTITQIDSLCMQCQKTGLTKLLMTRIPHFREIILTSFECEHCGYRNNGVESAITQDLGVCYTLTVSDIKDLNRQIVKSDFATVSIPSIEFEIPPTREKGEVTNLESLIQRVISDLEQLQPARRQTQSEVAKKIDEFINKLNKILKVEEPFEIKVDDPAGNSFIENLYAPKPDKHLVRTTYVRNKEQNDSLGINTGHEESLEEIKEEEEETEPEKEDMRNEVLHFASLCEKCTRPVQTNMKVTDVPNFKEVIIMATNCDHCGFRTNEVKSGSGISDQGQKISLSLKNFPEDMSRDVLKSDTCHVLIPELDIYIGAGILGGKFTTVEGLITDVKDDLSKNPFLCGDSTDASVRDKIDSLITSIEKILNGSTEATLILDDPAGNSYIQDIYTPEIDPNLKIENYDRNHDQNEELGLNDIKTENYAE